MTITRNRKEDLASWNYSPQMAGLIFNSFDETTCLELDRLFVDIVNNGGKEELDFSREPGVPFNPRPARIAYIQLIEAKLLDKSLLVASLNACIHENHGEHRKLVELIHWFDRARHIHMVEEPERRLALFHFMLNESEDKMESALQFDIPLKAKIKLWQDRAKKTIALLEGQS